MKQKQSNVSKDELSAADLLDYYWNYFELQSNQRMQMVNFFISIEIVLIGGMFTVSTITNSPDWMKYIVAGMITFVSFTFYLLDLRIRKLLDMCRSRIQNLEKKFISYGPDFYLISEGKKLTKVSLITYTNIYKVQYFVIGCLGIVCMVLIYYKYI